MTEPDLTASIPPAVLARASAAAEGYDPKARLWPVFKAILWLYKVTCVRHVKISGREQIVPGGRILVSNHARVSDSFLLPFIFGRLHGMAQVEAFTLPVAGAALFLIALVFLVPVLQPVLLPLFWFAAKAGFLLFFFIWVRGTMPRFRYDQLMGFAWKFLFPVAVANLLVTAILVAWIG